MFRFFHVVIALISLLPSVVSASIIPEEHVRYLLHALEENTRVMIAEIHHLADENDLWMSMVALTGAAVDGSHEQKETSPILEEAKRSRGRLFKELRDFVQGPDLGDEETAVKDVMIRSYVAENKLISTHQEYLKERAEVQNLRAHQYHIGERPLLALEKRKQDIQHLERVVEEYQRVVYYLLDPQNPIASEIELWTPPTQPSRLRAFFSRCYGILTGKEDEAE